MSKKKSRYLVEAFVAAILLWICLMGFYPFVVFLFWPALGQIFPEINLLQAAVLGIVIGYIQLPITIILSLLLMPVLKELQP